MQTHRYVFPDGVERVFHDVVASEVLPGIVDAAGHKRVFIVCSRTIHHKTGIVQRIRSALGNRCVGLTDDVGEHAPIGNVLKAAALVRDARADCLVTLGGGSVLDFAKFVQLCVSEDAYTRAALLQLKGEMSSDYTEMLSSAKSAPQLRQIAIPTTLSTGEWTPAGTPIDEETRLKVGLIVPRGAPQAIIYDPQILAQTPRHLLLSTGIRGLDHAVNTLCADAPHPLTSLLAEKAVALFIENLPLVARDASDFHALGQLQLAAWYTGMGQMAISALHGFSHYMVHVVGPYAGIPHSDAACVMMLAQARWLGALNGGQHDGIKRLLGRQDEPFAEIILQLLNELSLPTTLDELGVTDALIEEMIPHALAHPLLTKHNIRPITTAGDLRAILSLVK